MKKKHLVFMLVAMLALVGCSSRKAPEGNEGNQGEETLKIDISVQIIEKLDQDSIKAILVDKELELKASSLTDDSQIELFAAVSASDASASYKEFAQIVHDQMVAEKGHTNSAFLGSEDKGVKVVVFPRFVKVDEALVEAVNAEGNESVYTYKNVLVIVSPDFVEDASVIFTNLDAVLPEMQTK